jgi:uroporphyrinogen-III synthase
MTPTLILTRPVAQSESFAAEVAAQWDGTIQIIQSPLIEIVLLPATCDAPDAVIFTSANGVAAAQRLDLPKGLEAWCVGTRTAELAKAAGFVPVIGPGDADGLVKTLITAKPMGRLVHIRGVYGRGNISERLNAAGLICEDVIAYDQKEMPLTKEARSALAASDPVIFPLFSPRTATILNKQGPFIAPVHVVSMSDAVQKAVTMGQDVQFVTAQKPDRDSMVAATLALLRTQFGRS